MTIVLQIGSLVQFMAVDERQLFVMPDTMSFEDGALCEPLSVGIWACHRAGLQPGDSVLVTGAGPVGILAAQVARAFGAADVGQGIVAGDALSGGGDFDGVEPCARA